MTLPELKEMIQKGRTPSNFMIFIDKDNPFLAKQYLQAIESLRGGSNRIKSIYEPTHSSFSLLINSNNALNVLFVDTFDERAEDYSQFENTIVLCNHVDKSIINSVNDYLIKFPKFEEWQIFDYAKTLCPTVDDENLTWLIKNAGNIEKVVNELDKVTLFDKNDQKAIFTSLRFDPQTDLYVTNIYAIANALVNGDAQVLFNFLKHNGEALLDPVAVANRALINLKNIVLTRNPQLEASACGMSENQFKFIKRTYGSANIEAVKQKIKFLSKFDIDLKTSKLDLPKRDLFSYLIVNLNFKIT